MFEEFKEIRKKSLGEPMLTILKSGNLSLNKSAYEKYFKDFPFVRLFFDKDKQLIGIKPEKEQLPNIIPLRINERSSTVNMSAVTFLKNYEIPYSEKSLRYPLTYDQEHGLLVADLKLQFGTQ